MAAMHNTKQPLKFLSPAWFALVMGITGLSLAWHRATPLMGLAAEHVATVLALLAGAMFVLLLLGVSWRWRRHAGTWHEDLHHPVRHPFVAALPISLMLLASAGVALAGPLGIWHWLWGAGALLQLAVTVMVLGRWWRPPTQGGLTWSGVTPVLILPAVGNILSPLAGVPLGHVELATAQFAIGLLFWPVILALLAVRIAQQGLWAERLLPSHFILIAPPAAAGLGLMQLQVATLWVWAFWGLAMFSLLWVAPLMKRVLAQPFGLPHWAISFPLAALAGLTLRLAAPGSAMAVLALALLAGASLVALGLLAATWRGLRQGTLLVPEPVAILQPAGSTA